MRSKTNCPISKAWMRPDVLAASICLNLLALALPIVVLQVYDRILPNQSYETLFVFAVVLIGVAILDGLLSFARSYILTQCGAKYEYHTNIAAMKALLKSNLAAFSSVSDGVHLERFQGIEAIRDFYHGSSMFLIVDLPFVVLFLYLIWQFSGAMVLIPLSIITVFIIISYVAGTILRHAIRVRSDHHERRQNFVIECLSGMHVIKALAMEAQMDRRYERLQANSASSIFDLAKINTVVSGLATTFSQAVMVSFVAIGSIYVVESTLSIGALAAGTMLAGRVLQPALRALSFWTYLQSVDEKKEKLNCILNLKPESVIEDARQIKLRGKIELKHVSFSYGENEKKILTDINLVVNPSDAVSIRGVNGSGKSTLLNLIMGFTNPDDGQILIDDVDIKELDRSTLRSQIGLIPQQGVLFHGTLLENMTLYREGEPVVDAINLARKLGLDNTILKMPDGLDTMANSDLSQSIPHGFAQRLVMVRALVGKLSIVLFDDANPGFDTANDNFLINLLKEIREEHTLIVVSHRPSLQRICDRHYEIRDGRLFETGSAFQNKQFKPAVERNGKNISMQGVKSA